MLPRRTTRSATAASKAPIPAAPARAPQADLLPVLLGTIKEGEGNGPAVPTSRVEEGEDDPAAAALTDE